MFRDNRSIAFAASLPDCRPRRRRHCQPRPRPRPRPCSVDVAIARRIRKAIFQRKGPPPSFVLSILPVPACLPTHTPAGPGGPSPVHHPSSKLPQLPFFFLFLLLLWSRSPPPLFASIHFLADKSIISRLDAVTVAFSHIGLSTLPLFFHSHSFLWLWCSRLAPTQKILRRTLPLTTVNQKKIGPDILKNWKNLSNLNNVQLTRHRLSRL